LPVVTFLKEGYEFEKDVKLLKQINLAHSLQKYVCIHVCVFIKKE
jgi:hypothetical protein